MIRIFGYYDAIKICLLFLEFPIAWLGASEASLVVTTVNPWYTSEEISRQLISSRPKAIFCLVDNFDVIKRACTLANLSDTKVIAVKNELNQSFRNDMINFTELMNPRGMQFITVTFRSIEQMIKQYLFQV